MSCRFLFLYDADAIAQGLGDYNDPVAQGTALVIVERGVPA